MLQKIQNYFFFKLSMKRQDLIITCTCTKPFDSSISMPDSKLQVLSVTPELVNIFCKLPDD